MDTTKKGLECILRVEYSSYSAAISSFMSANSCGRRSLIPAFPRCRWSNAVKSTTSLPVCHTLGRNISRAAGKCSHDRVKMSRLISDYSAFLWHSSTSLLQLRSRPVISALLHQQGICHWFQEQEKGRLLIPAIFKRHFPALRTWFTFCHNINYKAMKRCHSDGANVSVLFPFKTKLRTLSAASSSTGRP